MTSWLDGGVRTAGAVIDKFVRFVLCLELAMLRSTALRLTAHCGLTTNERSFGPSVLRLLETQASSPTRNLYLIVIRLAVTDVVAGFMARHINRHAVYTVIISPSDYFYFDAYQALIAVIKCADRLWACISTGNAITPLSKTVF